jgi:hypothetical protein
MKNQSLISHCIAPPPVYDPKPAPYYSVLAESDGWYYLLVQVEIDINLKARGQSTSTLTLFQLLEIERLIPAEVENLLLTADQKQMLTDYACEQWKKAYDAECHFIEHAYDHLLDELIEHATHIRFIL